MRVALFNSRKPRHASPADRWVRLTLLAARQLARGGRTLVTGLGPLHYDLPLFVALETPGRAIVFLDAAPDTPRAEMLRRRYPEALGCTSVTIVHPDAERAAGEERDRAIGETADLAIVVEARRGGVMERIGFDLLRRHRPVLAFPPDEGPDTAGNGRLLDAGADELTAADLDLDPATLAAALAPGARPLVPPRLPSPFPPARRAGDWPYVMHYTRACPAELPGETRWAYVRSLVESRDPGFHRGSRVLRRILAGSCIQASGRLIRGGHAVVSFTAAHPADVAALARWARHLGRWTFEPYGMGVRRELAPRLGLRPVVYGPPGLYRALPEAERYLFQVADTAGIDWTAEREWRARGDVDLHRWPAADGIVVVPSEEEACTVRRASRFRVVSLAEAGESGDVGTASALGWHGQA